MRHQLASRITGCPKRADDIGLFADGVADDHTEHKSHDHNNHIQQDNHHASVTAHIFTGKINRLIQITRCIAVQYNSAIDI